MSNTKDENPVERAGASAALMGLLQKTKQPAAPAATPDIRPQENTLKKEEGDTTKIERVENSIAFQRNTISTRERQNQAISIGRQNGFTTIEKIDRRKTKPKHTPFHVSLSDNTIAAIRGYTDEHGFGSNREFIEYLIRLYEDSIKEDPV